MTARPTITGCRLPVLLSPRARADALAGWQGSDLKIRIAAPPADGAANAALIRFLAGLLAVSPARLSLASGPRNRRKVLWVEGLTEAELRDKLRPHLPAGEPDMKSLNGRT